MKHNNESNISTLQGECRRYVESRAGILISTFVVMQLEMYHYHSHEETTLS